MILHVNCLFILMLLSLQLLVVMCSSACCVELWVLLMNNYSYSSRLCLKCSRNIFSSCHQNFSATPISNHADFPKSMWYIRCFQCDLFCWFWTFLWSNLTSLWNYFFPSKTKEIAAVLCLIFRIKFFWHCTVNVVILTSDLHSVAV